MGAFLTNYQIRSDDSAAVRTALEPLAPGRAYVSPAKNGWVTVYEETSDDQDDAVLRKLAMGLSRSLKTAVFAFLVHDSDVLMYFLYRNGQIEDEYNSAPDYFGDGGDADDEGRYRGDVDALLPYCLPGTTRAQLDEILHPADEAPVFAESALGELAKLLGIDESRVTLGFRYFEEEGDALDDADQFEQVGQVGSAQPKKKRAAPPPPAPPSQENVAATFASAVGMMCMLWRGDAAPPNMVAMMQKQFDMQVPTLLEHGRVANCPSFEDLRTARDRGPEALADLLALRVPEQMQSIGVMAASMNYEKLTEALLARGLDPDAPGVQGMSPLAAAERHGKDSRIYQMLNASKKSS